ncbi:hypothetical protein BKA70DRAFT_1436340 [Coprinopsis sp. MPI-PUGE-AT-0042]|nr:hypothetical protein BKA70DRAFT_1436340 [Coprinopsis sp. MPI-PUGE-AT-0042]
MPTQPPSSRTARLLVPEVIATTLTTSCTRCNLFGHREDSCTFARTSAEERFGGRSASSTAVAQRRRDDHRPIPRLGTLGWVPVSRGPGIQDHYPVEVIRDEDAPDGLARWELEPEQPLSTFTHRGRKNTAKPTQINTSSLASSLVREEMFATPGLTSLSVPISKGRDSGSDKEAEDPGVASDVRPTPIAYGGRGGRVVRVGAGRAGSSLTIRVDGLGWSLSVLALGILLGSSISFVAFTMYYRHGWFSDHVGQALVLPTGGGMLSNQKTGSVNELTDDSNRTDTLQHSQSELVSLDNITVTVERITEVVVT